MKPSTPLVLSAAALIALFASGCYQSADITWYEAGHYKGARDPLLEKLKNKDFQQQLAERVHEVQADR